MFKKVLVLLMLVPLYHQSCVERHLIATNITLECSNLMSLDFKTEYNVTDPLKVVQLIIKDAKITEIPANVLTDFKNLKEINVTYSNVTTIEHGAFTVVNKLENLNLGNNNLHNISSEGIAAVTNLYLGYNKIDTASFTYAKKLSILNLEYNNFKLWPLDTFAIPTLETLFLTSNGMEKVGNTSFSGLVNLKVLYLDNNNITEIFDNGFENLKKLRELYLFKNSLTRITANTFFGLREIRYLHLSSNEIHTINSNAFDPMPYLSNLFLTENHIMYIDSQLLYNKAYLTYVWLNKNNLQAIPANLFKAAGNLEFVHLGDNNISHIEEFTFKGLQKVKNLFVDHNSITTLHENALVILVQAKYIDFSYNFIKSVKTTMLKKLDNINFLKFDHNEITEVQDFPPLKHLLHLDLSYNNITKYFSVKDCIQLSRLDLYSNNITEIQNEIFIFRHLNEVDLRKNPLSEYTVTTIREAPNNYIFEIDNDENMSDLSNITAIKRKTCFGEECIINTKKNTNISEISVKVNESLLIDKKSINAAQHEYHNKLLRICLITVLSVVCVAILAVLVQFLIMKKTMRNAAVVEQRSDLMNIMYFNKTHNQYDVDD